LYFVSDIRIVYDVIAGTVTYICGSAIAYMVLELKPMLKLVG